MAGEPFNLYDLLVNNAFGSMWMTYFGMALVFGIIGMIAEMAPTTLILLMALYSLSFLIQIMGGLSAALVFIIAFIYFAWQGLAFIMELRG